MTTPMSINRISEVNFEEGFTGDGKVFIEVQKQADNSEKLVIYEANNALTAFFRIYSGFAVKLSLLESGLPTSREVHPKR